MRGPNPGAEPRQAGRAFGALYHRDFRLLWGGGVIAQVGGWMAQLAQGWLVYDLTGSAFLLGLNGLFTSLTFILMSLYAGTVVDRIDRRKLIAWTNFINILTTLVVATLVATGLIQVWHIYLSSVVSSMLGAFDSPARSALLPHVVPRQDLMTAVSLQSIQRKGAQIIGPALGGISISAVGIAGTFYAQALAQVFLLVCIVLMRTTNPESTRAREQPLKAIVNGIKYVRFESLIGALILLEMLLSVFSAYQSMLVVFAREVFHTGPEGVGFLQSAAGFGSIAGSIGLGVLGDIRQKGRMMIVGGVIYGLALLAFAFCPWYAVAFPLLIVLGAMDIVFGATRTTIIQLLVRDDMLGRVMSLTAISQRGLGTMGSFVTGSLTGLIGSVQAAVGLGAVLTIAAIIGFAWRVPATRNFVDQGHPAESAAPYRA